MNSIELYIYLYDYFNEYRELYHSIKTFEYYYNTFKSMFGKRDYKLLKESYKNNKEDLKYIESKIKMSKLYYYKKEL